MSVLLVSAIVFLFHAIVVLGTKEFYFGVPGGASVKEVSLLAYTSNTTASVLTLETINGTIYSNQISQDVIVPISLDLVVQRGEGTTHRGVHAFTEDSSLHLALLISTDSTSDSYYVYPHSTSSNDSPQPALVEYMILAGDQTDIDQQHCYVQVLMVGTVNNTEVYSSSGWNGSISRFQTTSLEWSGTSCSIGSGSVITSTDTITVVSACSCETEVDEVLFEVEQMPPSFAWGRRFVVPPIMPDIDRQSINMIAALPLSVINISCSDDGSSFTVHLNRTQSYTIPTMDSSHVCSIASDSPLLVLTTVYYSNTSVATVIPSIEQSPLSVYIKTFPCSKNATVSIGIYSSLSNSFDVLVNGVATGYVSVPHDSSNVHYTSISLNGLPTVIDTTPGDIPISSVVFSNHDGCIYSHPSAYELSVLPVINVTFTQSTYEVLEDRLDGTWSLVIERKCFDCVGIKTRLQLKSNELPQSIEVEFNSWESSVEVILPFVNDDAFQGDRLITIAMDTIGIAEHINFYPIAELQLLIKDDDSVIMGIDSVTFSRSDHVVTVSYGVIDGLIFPSAMIHTMLSVTVIPFNDTGTSSILIYEAVLTSVVNRLTVDMMLAEDYHLLSVITITLTTTTSSSLLTINPGFITDSLTNISVSDASSLNDGPCTFVVGEFTSQSLLLITCFVGGLVVVLAIVVFISVTICLAFARWGRKWTASGTINRGFLYDHDAISLATNNPDTYELMNKLGEKKTARLTINDDSEYSG